MTPMQAIYRASPKASWETFCRAYGDWEYVPIIDCGEVIGSFMLKGNQVHVGMIRTPRASIRGVIRKVMLKVMREHGEIRTVVEATEERAIGIMRRAGFVEVSRDERVVQMICKEAPSWVGSQHYQQ